MNGIYRDLYVARKEPLVIEIAQSSNAIPLILAIKDWTVPSSATAALYIEKPSGALIFNNATISGNEITVPMTTQMTAEVGVNKCQLLVIKDTAVLHSFVFLMKVFETIIDDDAIESQDEFTALEEALAAVSDIVTHNELKSKGAANKGVYFDSSGSAFAMTYEVNSNVPAKPVISQSISVSSLPLTVNVSGMTANHKVVYCGFGTPSAQSNSWSISTTNGSYTISGTLGETTTLDLVFIYLP